MGSISYMSMEDFWPKFPWSYLQQGKSKSCGKDNFRKPNVKMKSTHTTTTHDPLHREQERIAKRRWQKFFSDPSQWWDHRFEKKNAKYPDFKHKETQESLWINGRSTPEWVKAELAAIPPGTLQLSVFAWNTAIARYVKDGKPKKAIEVFQEMQEAGIKPDKFTFCQVLKACTDARALEVGLNVHRQLAQFRCESDIFVGSCLIDMYSKCGNIEDACKVFNNMPARNVVSWNTMIAGYLRCGQGKKAVKLFQEMLQSKVKPDRITFMGVLNACANTASLEDGRRFHAQAIVSGIVTDPFVVSCLIDMYGKCSSIEDACQLFNNSRTEDVVIWSSMIMEYVKCGQGDKALRLYEQMQLEQVVLDSITYVGIICACASISALEEGRKVHAQVIKSRFTSVAVGSCLVDMYSKCGFIEDASRVFNCMLRPDAVAWNTMILAYVNCGREENAIELFYQMQRESVDPDKVTFMGVLKACANLAAIDGGRYVHTQIVQRGYELDVSIGSSLIDMYSKCGGIEDAFKAFHKVRAHNVVSWSAMIYAFVICGQGEKALDLFESMQREGVEPNNVTFVGVLNACANLVALEKGRNIHKQVAESSHHSDLTVGSSLIDMYSKCGSIEDARRVFDQISAHDTVSCTVMLGGYAMHGLVKQVIQLFDQMCREGFTLDNKSLVYLLSACSHAGYFNEGHYYFESMTPVYGISLTLEHYGCMVDLLGRTGHLAEAEVLINNISCQPTISIWMALLGACRMTGNVDIGKRIARKVLALEPENASGYVLLSDIYASW